MSTLDDSDGTRRDFLYFATAGSGAVAAGAAVWPLVNQMNPSADVRVLSTLRVDVSGVAPDLSELPDQKAQNANLPEDADARDENRALTEDGVWLVQMGICTHLGCVPLGDGAGDFGGWFCPCHGSHYDAAGRTRKGPAPRNLDIPVAFFVDETTIQLGSDDA